MVIGAGYMPRVGIFVWGWLAMYTEFDAFPAKEEIAPQNKALSLLKYQIHRRGAVGKSGR